MEEIEKGKKKRCQLLLSPETLKILDEKVEVLGYGSRSETMRYLIHNSISPLNGTNGTDSLSSKYYNIILINSLILSLIVILLTGSVLLDYNLIFT